MMLSKKFIFLLCTALITLFGAKAHACVSMAVAVVYEESATSTIAWQVNFNKESEDEDTCLDKAYETLEEILEYDDEYYDDILLQPAGAGNGGTLTGGRWVVVRSMRKVGGVKIFSYGLGASEESFEQAEERAAANLSEYDKDWDAEDHGYKIEVKEKF